MLHRRRTKPLVDLISHLHGIDGKLDVHISLNLAAVAETIGQRMPISHVHFGGGKRASA